MRVIEPFEGVFVFRLPGSPYVRGEINRFRKLAGRAPAPNSMNKYGVTLYGRELRSTMAYLQAEYVQPIAEENYPEIKRLKINPYAFIVDYEMDKQRSLAAHDDSADVTLNLCLTQRSEGGGLVFYDRAGRKPVFEIEHRVGQAIVHRGKHVHRAKSITSGFRSNLILWCEAKRAGGLLPPR